MLRRHRQPPSECRPSSVVVVVANGERRVRVIKFEYSSFFVRSILFQLQRIYFALHSAWWHHCRRICSLRVAPSLSRSRLGLRVNKITVVNIRCACCPYTFHFLRHASNESGFRPVFSDNGRGQALRPHSLREPWGRRRTFPVPSSNHLYGAYFDR